MVGIEVKVIISMFYYYQFKRISTVDLQGCRARLHFYMVIAAWTIYAAII